VLLPYDNANRFLQQMALHRGAMASWTAWVAPKTLKPAEAAHITGMNEALLREVNRIPPRMLVKVGSTLLVPRAPHSQVDVSEQVADNAMLSLAQEPRPLRKVSFRAGRQGTTVAAVARQYRVSTAQVAQWNGVTAQGHFKAGQAVTVMLPAGATANAVAAAAAAATAVRPASQAKPKAHAAPQRRTGAADQPRRKAQAAPR
jgi:membrane-bound lytic murein transglycosylase D